MDGVIIKRAYTVHTNTPIVETQNQSFSSNIIGVHWLIFCNLGLLKLMIKILFLTLE